MSKQRIQDSHPSGEPGGALQRYLDDESSARERAHIESHLAVCIACATEVREFRALALAVAQLPTLPLPHGLTGRILMAVDAERTEHVRARRPWLEWVGCAYALSAVGLLVALGLSPWRDTLLEGFRSFGSGLLSGSVGAVVGSFDRFVFLLDAAVRLGEASREVFGPLAPLWRSMEVLAAQPELRLGLALALVLSTALVWVLDQRRVRGPGRMNDAHAFI